MDKNVLLNQLNSIIKPVVEDLEYNLYYIEYTKESGEYYLRVYIDSDKGISLSDCERVSRKLSDILDAEDPIKTPYYLEVSSPGIERELHSEEHLKRYKGSDVTVKLSKQLEGKKLLFGILEDFNEDAVIIKTENKDVIVPKNIIKSMNLRAKF